MRRGLLIIFLLWSTGCQKDRVDVAPAIPTVEEVTFDDYLGPDQCRECHSEQYSHHKGSGHANTFAFGTPESLERFCGKTVRDRPEFGVFQYACDRDGPALYLRERFGEDPFPIDILLGSGQHAQTPLSLIPNRLGQTVGIEIRHSWIATYDDLKVTPGQQHLTPQQEVDHFGNVIREPDLSRCIDCHTTTAELDGIDLVHLQANVNCEECHGPGRRHVQHMQEPEALATKIVSNWNAREEIEMCGRCHRLPETFAADRLERYPPSLVRFQPVGVLRSECFLQSKNSLSCTTCHDPHKSIREFTRTDFEQTCLSCHGGKEAHADSTICPVNAEDQCIKCHMPRIEIHDGLYFHDHWIRVPEGDAP